MTETQTKNEIVRPDVKSKAAAEAKSKADPIVETKPSSLRKDNLEILQARRRRKLALRLSVWVLGPTLISAVYMGGVASDQFESVSPFAVYSTDAKPMLGLEAIIGVSSAGGSIHETLSVRDYILSRDMLNRLDAEHSFADHYKNHDVDLWTRLPAEASSEDIYEYYLDRVSVDHDTMSGNLTLSVRAYSAVDAQRFAGAILKYSEEMVNKISDRARSDQTAFAEAQVAKAEARLRKSGEKIARLQTEYGEFNPEQSAAAVVGVRSVLETELAEARIQLSQVSSVYQKRSPKVREARQRVAALKVQVAATNRRLVNPDDKGTESFSASLAVFQEAALEREFSQAAFQSTLTSLEAARAEASRQQRYLNTIAAPSRPDAATHPRKILGVLTVFFASFFLFGIMSLLGASIREHARL